MENSITGKEAYWEGQQQYATRGDSDDSGIMVKTELRQEDDMV